MFCEWVGARLASISQPAWLVCLAFRRVWTWRVSVAVDSSKASSLSLTYEDEGLISVFSGLNLLIDTRAGTRGTIVRQKKTPRRSPQRGEEGETYKHARFSPILKFFTKSLVNKNANIQINSMLKYGLLRSGFYYCQHNTVFFLSLWYYSNKYVATFHHS